MSHKRINVVRCARCGADHDHLAFSKLTRPFAPPEAGGLAWTHFAPCPSNGEPILLMIRDENAENQRAMPGSEVGAGGNPRS